MKRKLLIVAVLIIGFLAATGFGSNFGKPIAHYDSYAKVKEVYQASWPDIWNGRMKYTQRDQLSRESIGVYGFFGHYTLQVRDNGKTKFFEKDDRDHCIDFDERWGHDFSCDLANEQTQREYDEKFETTKKRLGVEKLIATLK